MASIEKKLRSIYRKNSDDLSALLTGGYPSYVYRARPEGFKSEIPVFVFHDADVHSLNRQLRFLATNGYRTLDADTFFDLLVGNQAFDPKCVLLTFDDGLSSVWTTAYPLLKYYGLKAVCFLIPHWIDEDGPPRPTLESVWQGQTTLPDALRLNSTARLCHWNEIEIMHRSGVIDFQSHSFTHASVYRDSKIIDFIHPRISSSFLNSDFQPTIHTRDGDEVPAVCEPGMPVYPWQPLFSDNPRYLEDPDLSVACLQFVAGNGGIAFFQYKDWRYRLHNHAAAYRRRHPHQGRFQTSNERLADMIGDLTLAKAHIEQRLDKSVRHLCLPWYAGGSMAVKAAGMSGYHACYWGIRNGRAVNRIGDDPFSVCRISEDYLMTLPGQGRFSLSTILAQKIRRLLKRSASSVTQK